MKSPLNPDDLEDRNRMIVAVLVSLLLLFAWQFFYAKPHAEEAARRAQAVKTEALRVEAQKDKPRTRAEALAESRRIPIKGARVTGSLSLKGLRIDDLLLNDQYVTVERKERVPLFLPSGVPGAFYAESGWLADSVALPSADTVWSLKPGSPDVLSGGGRPVVLTWDNGQGLSFEREIALDENYLFTVTQRVTNNTGAPVTLNAYHLVSRTGVPQDFAGLYTLHEGPVARLNGKLEETQYKDLIEGEKVEVEGAEGWLGITDKYWMAVVLPGTGDRFNARITASPGDQVKRFQADAVGAPVTIAPGAEAENRAYVYAGVKQYNLMKDYEKRYGFDRLEDAIDFGMWYFITKPFYSLFLFLVDLIGEVGFAVLAITVVVRAALFPLATKAYTAMAKMKTIQPLLKELQEKYKDDKTKLQMEIMQLYQRENANPFSGCLPMLVQIPIFFALYKVILFAVELRHAPFPGWVRDLSAPDPYSIFNLFGLIPWDPPQFLMIGGWPILFCLTMIVQKRLTPPMPDPVQEKIQGYFPYFITLMLAHFAVGLVIYWTWSNVLAILQQYYILKKVGGEDVSLIRGHHARRKIKKKRKE